MLHSELRYFEHDYAACKRSLQCQFGLGALGKIEFLNANFASSELRCLPLWRKLNVKITCGDWYPPIWCRSKKRYQLPGNVLSLQCPETVPSRHGGTLNSRRAARPLVRLVDGNERWEASDPSGCSPSKLGGGGPSRIVQPPV
ncbi:hypothetical protein TNCV_3640471 [Trichonephila clavipes]|nr:hypothetical protein TNCV_3640471 [Trichonephila clavipes]